MSSNSGVKQKKGLKTMSRCKRFWHAVLWIFLGFILCIGTIVGGFFGVTSCVKVNDLAGLVGLDQSAIGDELKDKTLLETIGHLSNFSNEKIGVWATDFFPGIDDFFEEELPNISLGNSGKLGQLITINMDKLHDSTFATLGNNIDEIIQFDVTFAGLKDIFNFSLPDMPIFSSTYHDSQGNVPIEMSLPDFFTFLQSKFDFDVITINDLETDFGIKLLTDDPDNLVNKILDGTWKVNEISTKIESKIDTLTLADAGINITDNLFEKVVGKCDEVTIGSLSSIDFTEKVNSLTLADAGINITDELFVKVVGDCNTITIGSLKNIDIEDEVNALTLSELGVDITDELFVKVIGSCSVVTFGELKSIDIPARINSLTLADAGINITDELFEKVVGKCDEVTIESLKSLDITEKVNGLTLCDAGINITDDLFVKVIGKCDEVTVGSLSSLNLASKIDGLTLADAGINITDSLFTKVIGDCNTVTIGSLKTLNFTEKVEGLTLAELNVNITDDLFIKVIGDCNTVTISDIKNLDFDNKIKDLYLVDVLGEPESGTLLYAICYDALGNKIKLGDASTRINNVEITEIYTDIELFVKTDNSYSDRYTFVKDGNSYKQTSFATGDNYYRLSDKAKIWLFLLCDYDESTNTFVYANRKLVDLESVVNGSGITSAFESVPIQILWEAGIIETKPNDLIADKTISELIG